MLGQVHRDTRGELMEFSNEPGQIYVSRTRPGAVRANHYHLRKTERFLVVEGQALLRERKVGWTAVVETPLASYDLLSIEIKPGWVHSIQNTGITDMVLVVWASEVFDPSDPDTYAEQV
jgi:UDP-2-acetamido-2,6-beta-L-arabino-hexul-4-ose reductase